MDRDLLQYANNMHEHVCYIETCLRSIAGSSNVYPLVLSLWWRASQEGCLLSMPHKCGLGAIVIEVQIAHQLWWNASWGSDTVKLYGLGSLRVEGVYLGVCI